MRLPSLARSTATLAAAAGLLAPLTAAAHADTQPVDGAAGDTVTITLADAITALPTATEDRTGYKRTSFRHWIDADRDGCSTRAEILLEEAITKPTQGERCALTGGSWHSLYDDLDVTEARGLDVDHMVPLAEAWDSGAAEWSAAERQDYANDLGDARALIAVTAKTNRSKADQDPAEWMPPYAGARCEYVASWVAVKTRWQLTADQAEKEALVKASDGCGGGPLQVVRAR